MDTVTINSLEYKIGRFGYAYYWNNGEWIKSDKEPDYIKECIEGARAKKLLSK